MRQLLMNICKHQLNSDLVKWTTECLLGWSTKRTTLELEHSTFLVIYYIQLVGIVILGNVPPFYARTRTVLVLARSTSLRNDRQFSSHHSFGNPFMVRNSASAMMVRSACYAMASLPLSLSLSYSAYGSLFWRERIPIYYLLFILVPRHRILVPRPTIRLFRQSRQCDNYYCHFQTSN